MATQDSCPEWDGWVRETLLCKHREAVRAEIERHKWIESEKAGYDIGWDRASVDWMIRHSGQFTFRNRGCDES